MTRPKISKKKTFDPASSSLNDEIRLLRGIIRQVAELTENGQPPADLLEILRTVGEASTRLATLIKAQHELSPSADLPAVLNQVLERIKAEMDVSDGHLTSDEGQKNKEGPQ